MSVKRYNKQFRVRDDVLDSNTPLWMVQSETRNPAGEWKPAAWLPVEWTARARDAYFVCSGGKPVSFDRENRLVPSGYRLRIASASTFVTYTSTDVEAGVYDIRTGQELESGDVGAVTVADVCEALLERGLVTEEELALGADFDSSVDAHCRAVIEAFVSHPVGIAAYDFFAWAGDDHDLHRANWRMQHLVQFITEGQLKVPHLVAKTDGSDAFDSDTITTWAAAAGASRGEIFPDGDLAGTVLHVPAATLAALARYDGVITASSPVVGLALTHSPAARNTDRTPVECSVDGILVRERGGPDLISQDGDWYLDADVGILFIHTTTWTDHGAAAFTVTYSYYGVDPVDAHRYVHLDGVAKPGDYVGWDVDSNFVVADSTDYRDVLGRILMIQTEPRGLLDRVKTAFTQTGFGTEAQMPGTATKGFSDNITFNSGTVADQLAILNIKVS